VLTCILLLLLLLLLSLLLQMWVSLTQAAYARPPTTPKLAPSVEVFRIPLANIQLTKAEEASRIQLEASFFVSDTKPPLKYFTGSLVHGAKGTVTAANSTIQNLFGRHAKHADVTECDKKGSLILEQQVYEALTTAGPL
jgi:hypothetical protein